MARMKGHKVRCRCVGCSPQTRKKGLRAAKSPRRKARTNPRRRGFTSGWFDVITEDGRRLVLWMSARTANAAARTMVYKGMRLREVTHRFDDTRGKPARSMAGGVWQKELGIGPYEQPHLTLTGPNAGQTLCGAPRTPNSRHVPYTGAFDKNASWRIGICPRCLEIWDGDGVDYRKNPGRRRPPLSMVAKPQPLVQLGRGEVVCSACGDHAVPMWADPCMDAVKARHKAAMTHRCSCPAKKQRGRVISNGFRTWIACDRCLGTIKQLNPGARDVPQPVSPRTKHYLATRGSVPGRKIGEYELKENPRVTKPPSIRTMEKWMEDGVAKATDGCRVEPDGVCEHGARSWLLELGMI